MKVSGKKLKRTCDLLGLVPSTPGVPSSMFVSFASTEKGLVLKLSSDVSVSTSVAGLDLKVTTPFAVDRRVLFPFIREEGEYDVDFKDGQLLLKQGRRKAELRTVKIDWSYGEWESQKTHSLKITSDLMDAIRCAKFCASDDPILPELNCVWIEFGKQSFTFASNDLIMCCNRGKAVETDSVGVAFPLALIDVLVAEDISEVMIGKGVVGGRIDGTRLWAQAPQKAWKQFPVNRLKKLIVDSRSTKGAFQTDMKSLVSMCAMFTGYLSNLPRQEWGLNVEVGEDSVNVEAKTSVAKFEDTLPATIRTSGTVMDLNLSVLAPIVAFLDGRAEKVSFTKSAGTVHVLAGTYEFLLSQKV